MTLSSSLEGFQALVCGASAGIGRAAALALAERGARVSVLARSRSGLASLLPELREAGAPAAQMLQADLEDRRTLASLVDAHLARHGSVHILVNNTGGPPAGPLLEAEEEDFLRAFGRHVLAAHLLVRAFLPGMREARYGRILNVISTSVREPIPGLGVSNTIRGAMASWAKTLSRELPSGVTVNNLLPGFTDTRRLASLKATLAERRGVAPEEIEAGWLASVPEGRLGRPEELGAVLAFLASPAAAFVRGQSLAVDGGRLASI